MELVKVPRKAKERAQRLRAIRLYLHGIASQRAFAGRLGVPYPRYNNWERGFPIPETEVKKIKDITPGLTGDFLLWGDTDGLTVETLLKLKSNPKDRLN